MKMAKFPLPERNFVGNGNVGNGNAHGESFFCGNIEFH